MVFVSIAGSNGNYWVQDRMSHETGLEAYLHSEVVDILQHYHRPGGTINPSIGLGRGVIITMAEMTITTTGIGVRLQAEIDLVRSLG